MEFKPNLIPNNRDGKEDIKALIEKNGGVREYLVSHKKDGCRVEFIDGKVLTRSLKPPKSLKVLWHYTQIAKLLNDLNIVLEGEFYAHGMRFNEVFRFFSNTDVERESEKKKMIKEKSEGKWPNRDVDWLTTFHDDLKIWVFDGYVKGSESKGYLERMEEIIDILKPYFSMGGLGEYLVLQEYIPCTTQEELESVYTEALNEGWEGLVLTHKDHPYKFGRTSLKQGSLLKMKDDKNQYDGIVLDVVEGTVVKEGVARTKDELGHSRTSKCKGDREPSGMAKGFLCKYEGEVFTVGLNGFDHTKAKELLENKEKYIGRHFIYVAMPPVKKVPRHAFFEQWRDPK